MPKTEAIDKVNALAPAALRREIAARAVYRQ